MLQGRIVSSVTWTSWDRVKSNYKSTKLEKTSPPSLCLTSKTNDHTAVVVKEKVYVTHFPAPFSLSHLFTFVTKFTKKGHKMFVTFLRKILKLEKKYIGYRI